MSGLFDELTGTVERNEGGVDMRVVKARNGVPVELKVFIPLSTHQRGGRKSVLYPTSNAVISIRPEFDNAALKAVARAHLWRREIESGAYASVTELARANRVNHSYACRVLRLTLLCPETVESIVNGRQPANLTLKKILGGFPTVWERQLSHFNLGI